MNFAEARLMDDMNSGRWVPRSYGNWFQCVRLKKDRLRTEETHPEKIPTLAACQKECRKLNKRGA